MFGGRGAGGVAARRCRTGGQDGVNPGVLTPAGDVWTAPWSFALDR